MAKVNKNSRRQQLINLQIGESLSFPPAVRSTVKAQISDLKLSIGQRYSVVSTEEHIIVTRIS